MATAPQQEQQAKPVSTAIVPKENVQKIRHYLDNKENIEQLKDALGQLSRWVAPEKLIRVTMTAVQSDFKLMIADPISIVAATIQLAQIGLVPDGFQGQAYLVPFKNGKRNGIYEAKPLIGYRGYGELITRSGQANSHDAHVVYEKDLFDFEYGAQPKLVHKFKLGVDRGAVIGAYAVVYMKEGPARFEVMSLDEIRKIQKESRGSGDSDSPWQKWFEEMARKTPLRKLAKYVSLSPEFSLAGGIDEANELGTTVLDETQRLYVQAQPEMLPPAEQGKSAYSNGAAAVKDQIKSKAEPQTIDAEETQRLEHMAQEHEVASKADAAKKPEETKKAEPDAKPQADTKSKPATTKKDSNNEPKVIIESEAAPGDEFKIMGEVADVSDEKTKVTAKNKNTTPFKLVKMKYLEGEPLEKLYCFDKALWVGQNGQPGIAAAKGQMVELIVFWSKDRKYCHISGLLSIGNQAWDRNAPVMNSEQVVPEPEAEEDGPMPLNLDLEEGPTEEAQADPAVHGTPIDWAKG